MRGGGDQRERALEAAADHAHRLGQPARARRRRGVGGGQQVRGDLGVGLGAELDAARPRTRRAATAKFSMIPLWMTATEPSADRCGWALRSVGPAVGRPPGVADADRGRRERLVGEHLLQVGQLAGLLRRAQLAVGDDRDPRGVVAPVLEPAQPVQDDVPGVLRTDVTHDAAHFTEGTGGMSPSGPGPERAGCDRHPHGALGPRRQRDAAATTSARRAATSSACSWVGASTITRTSCSVPEGRSSTRPVSPSSSSTALTASATSSFSATASRSVTGTLTRTCGSFWTTDASSAREEPVAAHARHQREPGEQPVAGRRVVEEDQVAALLAAEAQVCGAQRLQHVPVADGGGVHRDPGVAHRVVEAEVAHDGGDDGVLRELAALVQRQRADGQDRVAVDEVAVGGDGQAAVGVAVVGDAEVGAVRPHRVDQRPEVGGPDPVVDVPAVGRVADRVHRGPGAAVDLGRDRGGGAVRAVHDDA